MELDLSQILPFLTTLGLTPKAILVISSIFLVVQHFAGKNGVKLTLAGVIDFVLGLLGKKPVVPTPDPVVVPKPTPAVPAPSDDPLADRPILKSLRDIILAILARRLTTTLASGDEETAVVKALTEFSVGPFVGPGPSVNLQDGSVFGLKADKK